MLILGKATDEKLIKALSMGLQLKHDHGYDLMLKKRYLAVLQAADRAVIVGPVIDMPFIWEGHP